MISSAYLRLGLSLLFLCCCASARGASEDVRSVPLARWTIFHVSGVAKGTWSQWFTALPWPVRFRFTCSNDGPIVNFVADPPPLTVDATVTAYDIESDEDALDRAIASGQPNHTGPFSLGAGQSLSVLLHRPGICSASTPDFFFGAIIGPVPF